MRPLASLLCLSLTAAACASPAEAVAAAHADAQGLPKDAACRTRYLSLYAIPEKRRAEFTRVIDYHANSLSREAFLQPARRVGKDLLAVDLQDYGWDAKVWERFLTEDPYFHAVVEVVTRTTVKEYWPGGQYQGEHWDAGYYDVVKTSKVKKASAAPWTDPKSALALALATNSEVPVVRADWFLYQTAIQLDRKAGYYDFLGLGKAQQDFDDLAGIDLAKARKARREIFGVVAQSGVTLQNRVVARLAPGYWATFDFKKGVNRANVLRQLDDQLDPPEGDASERYTFLPNGLFAFWLQNGQGVRQDFAPDFIASDRQATSNDGRVHVGLSCVRCHVEGLRPVDDYARKLYRGNIKLASPDHAKLVRLRQLYLTDLKTTMSDDVTSYGRALFKVSGFKPAELARAYSGAWKQYAETDLDLAAAALELGVGKERLARALKARAASLKGLDPVLAGLVADEPLEVRREHWEEAYPLAQEILQETPK